MSSLKSATFAATVALTLFDVAAAEAADLGSRRAPVAAMIAAPADLWTGFYLGGHLSYRQDNSRFSYLTEAIHPS
ncbi:hypothetical protein ABTK11_21715, partial [Acinetobacter baumannii]